MSATRLTSANGVVGPSGLDPVRAWASSIVVLAAWLAAASTAIYAIYSVHGVVILSIVTVLVLLAIWFGAFRTAPPTPVIVVMAVGVVIALIVTPPKINVNATGWLFPAVIVGCVAALSVLVVFLSKVPVGRLVLVPLGITALSFAGMILGGAPQIDVWVIFQDAARGLLHGQNPYQMSFVGVPAGQTSGCFNYLPFTFLVTAPGQWLFGDVRWVEAGCLLAAGAVLVWHVVRRGGSRRRVALAALVTLTPGSLLVVQQAWNEPILLLGLIGTAVLMDRGRWSWAMVPFGLALATKQHLVLFLPLLLLWPKFGWRRTIGTVGVAVAVCLPWLAMNPTRFTRCTADFFLGEQAPAKALSIWRLLPGPLALPLLLVGLAVAFAVVVWRCPRTPAGFLIGSGTVFVVFDLLNKQTFVNQWWLAAALLVSGLALNGGTEPADPDRRTLAGAGVS